LFLLYGSPIILVLSASNIFTKFLQGHSRQGAKYRWGIKISLFSTDKSLYLANDTRYAIVTVEGEQELVCDLSNGAIFNDLVRPQTHISRSGHSLTLNISEMAKDTAIVSFLVTMEGE